jgi:hypothetical protein
MKTITCFYCKAKFGWKKFLQHLKYFHKHETVKFPCGEDGCCRKFQSLISFKSHLQEHNLGEFLDDNQSFSVATSITCPLPSPQVPELQDSPHSLMDVEVEFVAMDENIAAVSPGFTKEDLLRKLMAFDLSVHNYPNIPRNFVPPLHDSIKKNILTPFKNYLQTNLADSSSIDNIFDEFFQLFDSINSEKKLCKELAARKSYVYPTKRSFNHRRELCHKKGMIRIKELSCSFTYVSMKETISILFEIPNVFEQVLTYVQSLPMNGPVSSFLQSEFWQEKAQKIPHQDLILPFFLYIDGFGVDNPLGTKKNLHPIEAVYAKLPFIPPAVASKLVNIFFVMAFKKADKKHGFETFLAATINEAMDLEKNGLTVSVNGQKRNIKLVFSMMLGDNLGLNEVLGYICSFRGNHPCRICRVRKEILQVQHTEDKALLRSAENYTLDQSENDATNTGIKEKCALAQIPTFNVWDNVALDIMHDIFEGVAHYDLSFIFLKFLEDKYFDLAQLNERVQLFDYGNRIGDAPTTEITINHLQNRKLPTTASEMICFIEFLPLMIGDLIPRDDKTWELFLLLSQIVEIMTKYEIDIEETIHLDDLVARHHKLYIELFSDPLKFKFHNLVHAGSITRRIGPLMNIWCMRLEGKHKELKQYCRVNNNRKNLPYSLACKNQLKFSHRLLDQEDFSERIKLGTQVCETKYADITFNGTKYEPGLVVHFDCVDNHPVIGTIQECKFIDNTILFTVSTNVKCISYDHHFRSYVVANNPNQIIKQIEINEVLSFPRNVCRLRNKTKAIVLQPLPH